MSTKQKKEDLPKTKDLRAKAVANLTKHIEMIDVVEKQGVGHWVNIPKGLESWHFVRFSKAEPYHREVAHAMLAKGYLKCEDAAPEVRCIGFESDGENRLYLCCPPEVHVWHQNEKERNRRKRFQILEKDFGSHLANIDGDISIEHRKR